jgi:hypothetical protein
MFSDLMGRDLARDPTLDHDKDTVRRDENLTHI